MNQFRKILSSPYPLKLELVPRLFTILAISGFVFLFLLIFQPFSIHEMNKKLWMLAGYEGMVVAYIDRQYPDHGGYYPKEDPLRPFGETEKHLITVTPKECVGPYL